MISKPIRKILKEVSIFSSLEEEELLALENISTIKQYKNIKY